MLIKNQAPNQPMGLAQAMSPDIINLSLANLPQLAQHLAQQRPHSVDMDGAPGHPFAGAQIPNAASYQGIMPRINMSLIALLKATQMQRQNSAGAPQQIQRPVVPSMQVPTPAPAQPPKAPKAPKAEVSVRQMSLEQFLAQCKLNRSFVERRLRMQRELRANMGTTITFTDGAVAELATALKLRMTYLAKEAVWYCKQRQTDMYPKERVFVDVPRVNFAMLEAERRILESGKAPGEQQECKNNVMKHLKDETLVNICAQTTDSQHEAFAKLMKDKENEEKTVNNYNDVISLTNNRAQPNLVITDDIITVIENDAQLSSSPTLIRNFHFNQYKIQQQK